MPVAIDTGALRRGVDELRPERGGRDEDLHAHPEPTFPEHRTAGIVAPRLDDLGDEVTTGVGGTGVVATLAAGVEAMDVAARRRLTHQ